MEYGNRSVEYIFFKFEGQFDLYMIYSEQPGKLWRLDKVRKYPTPEFMKRVGNKIPSLYRDDSLIVLGIFKIDNISALRTTLSEYYKDKIVWMKKR